MATVYSLIAWGGRTGKTVTLTIASPCVVTSTSHGLRDGTGLRFKSNGDTLPTGLTSGVTYYAKSTAANTFNLYSDAGLTTIINTSGTQSGTHILQSLLVADPANALAPYGLSDLSRWGSSGSERIYDGISTWHAARLAPSVDSEVAEIGEAFTSYYAGVFTIAMGSASSELVTKINGIRTSAFHAGKMPVGTYAIDNGFVALGSGGSGGGFNISSANTTLDGFVIENVGGTYAALLSTNNIYLRKMICKGPGSVGNGINFNGAVVSTIEQCVSTGYAIGFRITGFASGLVVTNNLAVGNVKGFSTDGSSVRGWYYNNIAIGNTTNWDTWTPNASALICVASNNAGLSGEAWITTGKTRITMATTDFADYANSDFRPALSSSPQVDTGVEFYGISSTDISDAEAPNYNNGGSEAYDIGAYEFDHGFGPHPASHELTLTNVVVGSRVFIRDQADTTTHHDAIAASSTVVVTITVYGDTKDNWRIRIRKASASPYYQPYETLMTATAGESSIYVSQIPDEPL